MDILQGIERVSRAIEALSNEVEELKLLASEALPSEPIFRFGRIPGA